MKNNEKVDLRVIKTKNLIKNTFFEMVQTYGYQKVTIKELCDNAMINRNTFYLHYQDKDSLVKELISEVFVKYEAKLKPLGDQFLFSILKNDKEKFQENITSFLYILNEDIELYRIILMDNYLAEYFKTFEKAYEKLILGRIVIRNNHSKQIFKYFIGGTTGVLVDWILTNTTSIDETSNNLTTLIYENVKQLIAANKRAGA